MSHGFAPAPEPATELGRHRVLCPNAAVRVSPLALGAMSIGDAWSGSMGSLDKKAAFELLDGFVAAGGNFIDTANAYQDEQSESWIGEWSALRGNRDKLVIATKYSGDYRAHELGLPQTSSNYSGNSRKSMHMSVRASLRKLQTDYIDLLYVHFWDYTTSIREMMDGLHVLVEQGKVLYLGASDMPAWVVSAANTYAVDNNKTPFSVYQGFWNVMKRDFERDIIPMARMFGMALVPWGVVGGGKFQSAKALEERRQNKESLRSFMAPAEQMPDDVKASEALAKVAAEHGIESVTAVALAYVMHKAPNVVPIVGGRKIEQLHDNIAALSLKLTDEQVASLEKATPSFDIGFPQNIGLVDPQVTGYSPWLERTTRLRWPSGGKSL